MDPLGHIAFGQCFVIALRVGLLLRVTKNSSPQKMHKGTQSKGSISGYMLCTGRRNGRCISPYLRVVVCHLLHSSCIRSSTPRHVASASERALSRSAQAII